MLLTGRRIEEEGREDKGPAGPPIPCRAGEEDEQLFLTLIAQERFDIFKGTKATTRTTKKLVKN